MPKIQVILCGLVCVSLAVVLCGCGGPEGGQSGAGTGTGGQGQTGNLGGNPIPRKGPVEEKRAALDGTEWDIDVVLMIGTERKTTPDKLRFANGQVLIEEFEALGYHASNYSLRIEPDKTVVWETMQTGESGSILFLRGNWRGDKMSGTITSRPKTGKNERFTFVSTASRKLVNPPPAKP